MSALLVGLENRQSDDRRNALYPRKPGSAGSRIVAMINDVVDEPYLCGHYLRDFTRTNLYPTRRAPTGPGSTDSDRDAAAHIITIIESTDVDHVALFGRRVTRAIEGALKLDGGIDYLESVIFDAHARRSCPVWIWSLPHPSVRNRWYNDDMNRRRVGAVLAHMARRNVARRTRRIIQNRTEVIT